ncbi:MAG: cytidine/deoxycytidylate deaminase family protein [Bdellovibrionales bacterium]|nr:cytidine/deoxycytidylate deaminase family protein [Bdellovibrionales bacterium]
MKESLSERPDEQQRLTQRPSWDEYFLEMIEHVASRATCDRGRSGCVIARDKRVLATGYVGSPPGLPHCDDVGHLMKRMIDEDGTERKHCVRTVHAEQNAICQAARYGIPIEGSTLYCKMEPCRVCAMLIISVGISRVVCRKRYHAGADTRALFKEAGIVLEVTDDEIEHYAHQ